MANRFDFLFEPAEALATRLLQIPGAPLRAAQVRAVNEVTSRFDVLARRRMNEGISLSDAYVKSKVRVDLATREPEATITAAGDLTILGHFPLHQMYRQANRPARAKGDPARGIPAGSRAAGVRVTIKTAAPTAQARWFTMKLRRGTAAGDKIGVFARAPGGRARHMYGPSPYSLFRFQVKRGERELQGDLERTGLAAVQQVVEGALR